jgi:hypothetical protein
VSRKSSNRCVRADLAEAGPSPCFPTPPSSCCVHPNPHALTPQPGGVHDQLKPWAYGSLVAYTLGLPAVFAGILVVYRREILADQELRSNSAGNSRASNPHFSVRQRFQELYRWGSFLGGVASRVVDRRCGLVRLSSSVSDAGAVAFVPPPPAPLTPSAPAFFCRQLVSAGVLLVAPSAYAAQVLHGGRRAHVQQHTPVPGVVRAPVD